MARGFILHPTYRIEGGRPVVHLYGRLESGEPFLVRDGRMAPYFFIRAADAARGRELGATRQSAVELLTMRGEPVVRVEVATPPDTPPLRDALLAAGIPVFEGDVRFAMRYLIDRGLRGSIGLTGEGRAAERGTIRPGAPRGGLRLFENPEIAPADWEPAPAALSIVSLDLETDPRGERIFSAALSWAGAGGSGVGAAGTGAAGSGAREGGDEVLLALPEERVTRALAGASLEGRVVPCGDERGLLKTLGERLCTLDFDILTGWNVIDFDLSVLVAAAQRLGVPLEIGRAPGAARVVRDTSFWGRSRAEITGRLVLDGIDLLKGAFVKLEDYKLDTAARVLLGEGKVEIEPPGAAAGLGKAEAIERAFRDDLPLLVRYNLADARLVLGILAKARLIELAVRRSLLTGMPLDRVGASIASFDFLYLGELRRRGRVAPTVGREAAEIEPTLGGAVLEPAPGLYENVLAFDFKSLYPSLIRTFNLDPLGLVADPAPGEVDDLIRAPNGACFRRAPGILPELLKDLFPRRDEAKRRGDAIGSHAIKILMNSFYGVLATPACRFYSSAVANAITHFGQWVLHWARDRVEALGHRVLYGDTDSLFVLSGRAGRDGAGDALRLGPALCGRINEELRATIRETWKVESHLELEFETLFLKFFLPSVRHGGAGARKRYAGLVRAERPGAAVGEPAVAAESGAATASDAGTASGAAAEVIFVGMEVMRRDWTEMSKTFQRGLYERLFRGESAEAVSEFLRAFVSELRAGRHDRQLVYRKALRKGLEEYTATTPPHVKAARKLGGNVRGLVEYVMTTSGPEPASARGSAIDYEHYVEKQIRPIAEQVLTQLGISFEQALGETRQGTLF